MNVGSQPSFVDTNVLVYAVADDDPARQLAAQTLVDTLTAAQALHTSTQVLQELYVVLTRRVRRKFTNAAAIDYLDRIARAPVTTTDYKLVRQAAELSGRDAFSFWDALVLVAAARSGATRLYTEDLQHGRTVLGVQIVNPFRRAGRS
jgi:predicted nucleic acid-binding protein